MGAQWLHRSAPEPVISPPRYTAQLRPPAVIPQCHLVSNYIKTLLLTVHTGIQLHLQSRI